MSMNLATKYRPQTLDEVCGQENIVKILRQQLKVNTIKNSYLFCGSSGCGKTSLARILAREINRGVGSPIEFDAASNSSVEDVRKIIDASNSKSITGEYKIYIIDEAHSLSSQAWQAFLKTLEEPSIKTIFIFCTTEVQKVPTTILNRVQRFDLTRISQSLIIERLKFVCNKESFTYEDEALAYIAKLSKGRMRDAITYLEKVASFNSFISLENSVQYLNALDYQIMFKLTNAIIDRKESEALSYIQSLDMNGKDLKVFINEYTSFIVDVNKFIILRDFNNIDVPKICESDLMYLIKLEEASKFYLSVLNELVKLKEQIRYETDVKLNLEIMVLFLCK